MRILLDNCTPSPLRRYLRDHSVHHCSELGWANLGNGELLAAAEAEGFDLFITCDRNLRYQQNFSGRRLAILELGVQLWPRLEGTSKNLFGSTLLGDMIIERRTIQAVAAA